MNITKTIVTKGIATAATTISQMPHVFPFLISTKTSDMNLTTTPTPNKTKDCLDDNPLQTSLAVLYSFIFVPGLVGNLVALWAFFSVHSKKNSVRVFLINIAFADLLLMVCLPFRVLYHSRGNTWSLGPTLCKAVGTLFYMNMYISITLLGMISVDRYLKIHHGAGMWLRLLFTRWSAAICAAVWIVAFAMTLVIVTSKSHPPWDKCFHYKQLHDAKWKAYINIFVLLIFWLVFISLMASYGKIALNLLKRSKEKPDLPNASRYSRTAKKSFFILFVFTVCFVPYHLVRIFYIKTQITDTSCFWMGVADKTNEIALLFSALNSCLDPVMYFLISSSVRKEVLRMAGSMCCVRDDATAHGSSSTVELEDRVGRTDRGETNISSVSAFKQ
ncbi:putative G-protein coupled receptor 34b [Sphaeramia orbicularis]|uniref:Probable G-protein coupled receptor 34 n=1 Tax=Sphaeramia orbicularis TaxID=375764 RepID=A0A673CHY8_9TELE|nr:probable G-protein coupled receptor 34 [Sphaeramia orbicularis]